MSKIIDPKDWNTADVRSFEDQLIVVLKEIVKELKKISALMESKQS